MNMVNFWETEDPVYVDDKGVKWWVDEYITQYCRQESKSGGYLKRFIAYVLQYPDGKLERVLICNDEIIAKSNTSEGIIAEVDKLKLKVAYILQDNTL